MIHPKSEKENHSLDSLKKIRVDPPASAGSRWKELHHYDLLEAIAQDAKRRSWTLSNPQCVLGKNQLEMAASWDVEKSPPPEKNALYSLGVTNSLNLRKRPWVYGGVRLIDKEAGIPLYGQEMPKHTIHLDIEKEAAKALDGFDTASLGFHNIMFHLSKKKISVADAFDLLIIATNQSTARPRILSSSRSTQVTDKFRKEKKEDQHRWKLLVLFAQLTNEKVPTLWQMRNVFAFYNILKQH